MVSRPVRARKNQAGVAASSSGSRPHSGRFNRSRSRRASQNMPSSAIRPLKARTTHTEGPKSR